MLLNFYWIVDFIELEQDEALRYLRGWLQHHPKYGALVPGNVSEQLIPSEVSFGLAATGVDCRLCIIDV